MGNNEKYTDHVLLWTRFIDDLFLIWDGSREEAEQLIRSLNNRELNFEFTNTISFESV